MSSRVLRAFGFIALACACGSGLAFAQTDGKISGVVLDAKGVPQMGASVLIASEQRSSSQTSNLLTNGRGRFSSEPLPAGSYSIKVTLAGFLPAMEQHIRVSDQRVTLLQVVMGSVFSSFQQLRGEPGQKISADDWTWVLRASPDTRSVLRWTDGPSFSTVAMSGTDASAQKHEDHVQMRLTSGADHPGSIATPDSPATAVVYDMGVGATARLLMAGEFSYAQNSPAEGFAAEWLPSGEAGAGRVLTLEARQTQVGPMGPIFRGFRVSDSDKLAIGDRVSIRYGAEYVAAGFGSTTQALHPHGEVAVHLAPSWLASVIVAAGAPQETGGPSSALQSALNDLDAFPILMVRDGRPVLENGWHEEFAIDHALTKDADISAAVFHDRSTHTAVMGRGGVGSPDFLQDFYSDAFAYDGGTTSSTGVRVTYRQKFSDSLDATVVYAYAGALAPNDDIAEAVLRDELSTQGRESVAGRISAKLPLLGTRVSAGYKWINGPAVSQVDPYGESLNHIDPYLSLQVRQPLPKSLPCHMEFMADVGNLLAQGYIPLSTTDGRVILVPSYRYFRGGLSLQF